MGKFNRGQLLNIGYRLAEEALPGLTSYITHDVDLLPSMEMQEVYANTPPEGHAVHLASVWQKYSYATFIGGVLAFRPRDFERVNGYPNNYWGWGLEDDQLVGSFEDLDPVNMKGVLETRRKDEIQRHLPWYNADMFRKADLGLDHDWETNGVRGLEYRVLSDATAGRVRHCLVELGPVAGARE